MMGDVDETFGQSVALVSGKVSIMYYSGDATIESY
jgi:hypothetical protein